MLEVLGGADKPMLGSQKYDAPCVVTTATLRAVRWMQVERGGKICRACSVVDMQVERAWWVLCVDMQVERAF